MLVEVGVLILGSRQEKAKETRENIAKAALSLFAERSYDEVGIADIVKSANVSVGAFYHHYKSKDDILMSVFEGFDAQLEEEWDNNSFQDSNITMLKALYKGKAIVCELATYRGMRPLLTLQMRMDSNYIFDSSRFFLLKAREIIANCIHEGTLCGNADKISEELIQWAYGAIYSWVVSAEGFDLKERFDRIVDMFVGYYSPKKSDTV